MKNLASEQEAKDLLETIIRDPGLRSSYISVLADAILEAHRIDPTQWIVTAREGACRLLIGHYATYWIGRSGAGVWLALATDRLEDLLARGAPEAFLRTWKPDKPHEYAHYKDRSRDHNPFSTNGWCDVANADSGIWPTVEALSFAFISEAIEIGQRMPRTSRPSHAPGVLKYMRTELGRRIPDPVI